MGLGWDWVSQVGWERSWDTLQSHLQAGMSRMEEDPEGNCHWNADLTSVDAENVAGAGL